MKIKFVIFAAIITIPLLSSCSGNNSYKLTFGTLVDDKATKLEAGELISTCERENFLLTVYPGDTSTCSCWTNFRDYVLNKSVSEDHYKIYQIPFMEVKYNDTLTQQYRFEYRDDRPLFYIFADGQIRKKYVYGESNIFIEKTAFIEEIEKYTTKPNMFYVDEELLSIKTKTEECDIAFMRNSCADCKYCIPKVLTPFFESGKKRNMYVFDLDKVEKDLQQQFKDDWFLSKVNNETYGYNGGYVPTFHHYKNGKVVDACVYFNDTIGIDEEGNGYIKDSFYTFERSKNLKYLDNVEKKVLLGTKLQDRELNSDKTYWKNNEYAAIHHNPFLKGYLTYYLTQV